MYLRRADAAYLALITVKQEDGGFWSLHRMGTEPPSEVLLEPKAQPFVLRGAWRVHCPRCTESQFGDPSEQERFSCTACGLGQVLVDWPEEAAEIEEVLLRRRTPAEMNWLPHEPVEQLYAENIEHDIGGDVPKRRRPMVDLILEAKRELDPLHVIARGTIVHPDSEMHPAKILEYLRDCGRNFSESEAQRFLHVYGRGW